MALPVTHHRRHYVRVIIEDEQIGPFENYRIESNLITPADGFSVRFPFSAQAWNLLERDAAVRVMVDATAVVDGFIDRRRKLSREGAIEIIGRDRVGRLMDESAPTINFAGLMLDEAVRRLSEDWFGAVALSDARNRSLRRGKGRRVPAGNEPLVINIRVPKSGRVHPGMTRWQVIEEICSKAGYLVTSSADGEELIVLKPNYSQAAQYLIVHPREGSKTKATCKDLIIDEDNGDRYSLITVAGAGGSDEDDVNYGSNVTSRKGRWKDGPGLDGIGRDFKYPKRLYLPEKDFESNGDAQRVAELEAARRNFKRTNVTAIMPFHGQFISANACTIFAPNTIARVIDEDFAPVLDAPFWIYSCVYSADRASGETTELQLVPSGTEVRL